MGLLARLKCLLVPLLLVVAVVALLPVCCSVSTVGDAVDAPPASVAGRARWREWLRRSLRQRAGAVADADAAGAQADEEDDDAPVCAAEVGLLLLLAMLSSLSICASGECAPHSPSSDGDELDEWDSGGELYPAEEPSELE